MKYNYIYKITCLCGSLKDHYYIGKHTTSKLDDGYAGSGIALKDYFEKYGKELGVTYTKEILEYNDSKEMNATREKEILGDLWITDPMCINLAFGGGGGIGWNKGKKMPEEFCERCRINSTGRQWSDEQRRKFIESNTGHIVTEETKEKISKGNSGKKRTKEVKEKLSEAHKGIKYGRAKTVYQYSLSGEFIRDWHSAIDIEKETGFSHSNIYNCCNGKLTSPYGYIWSYEKNEVTL